MNNVKKYFLYAIGEVLLIVVGILIAIQIGERNQERRDRKEERVVLQAFANELEVGLRDLRVSLASLDHKDAALKQLAIAIKGPIEDNEAFLLSIATASAYGWGLPLFADITFQEQVNSGKLLLIENAQLRRKIYEFYDGVKEQEERAVLRVNPFANIAYELVPRAENYEINGLLKTGDYQVLQGLSEQEYAELATSVLNSELGRHIIPEQNRSKFLRGLWLHLEIQTTDLLAEIKAELEGG